MADLGNSVPPALHSFNEPTVMPARNTRRGQRKGKTNVQQNYEYWARLRRDIYRYDYQNGRAYSPIYAAILSTNLRNFRYQVELNEELSNQALDRMNPQKKARLKQIAVEKMKKSKIITAHWENVAQLGCIISGMPAEIAHCHGGSISTELGPKFRPGMAERQNHWLVIPLNPNLHRGQFGLDTSSVEEWEHAYGKQTHFLEEVSHRLGYDVFKKAEIDGYEYQAFHRPGAIVG